MDEADVEHAGAKDLIAQLQVLQPGDDHYDAKVTVLCEQVRTHIKEEHSVMFPKVKKSKTDLDALGAALAERKAELQDEMGLNDATADAMAGVRGPSATAKYPDPLLPF